MSCYSYTDSWGTHCPHVPTEHLTFNLSRLEMAFKNKYIQESIKYLIKIFIMIIC